MSLPTRERGLKLYHSEMLPDHRAVAPHAGAWIEISPVFAGVTVIFVAPHAGAWIEIIEVKRFDDPLHVAPHAGAWIEIAGLPVAHRAARSLPTRERGLKSVITAIAERMKIVAPHAGAWIEIPP